jgi:DNA-binding transcriptional LysR family regulator
MHFSVDQMAAFYWLAKLRNFREVGERLGVSQSGISLRIKELERQAGSELLVRDGPGITLTARGELLYNYADELMRLRSRVVQSFGAPKHPPELLRIGAAESFVTTALFPFLNALSARRPELSTQISVEHSHLLYGKLIEREIDVAFLSVRTVNPTITLIPLCDIELKWAVPQRSPLLERYVHQSDLLAGRIITMPPVSNIFQYMIDWFEGETPANVVTCNSLATNVEMISTGYGAGIVPVCMTQAAQREGRIGFLQTIELPLDRVYMAFSNRRQSEGLLAEASAVAVEVIARCDYPGVVPVRRNGG